ncbi:TPR repeat-containing protein [Candidatus Magnetomorum sp. HK-1]|nr:TPR repeat-containing protein [Candidatus Magnetomorum sp. HK-1]
MRKIQFYIAIFIITCCTAGNTFQSKHYAKYWEKSYGKLSENDNHLVKRTNEIFQNVLIAADKKSNRSPKLLIVKSTELFWPRVLRDGTVILTKNVLERCYQDENLENGDAKLAYIIGHELAHLAQDDYWSENTEYLVEENIKKIIKSNLKEDLTKELRADAYGMLYMFMAGYNPYLIMNNGKIFFHNWSNHPDDQHPNPGQRAKLLMNKLDEIHSNINLFYLGIRLFQLGKYEDSLSLLIAFKEMFPCREVSNAIGLLYYQKSINALSKYKPEKTFQYKLSIILDMETRANKFGTYKADNYPKKFKDNIKRAIQYFQSACDRDLLYIPSRVNLSAALILNEEYSKAEGILEDAIKINPNDPGVINNNAIAIYLNGRKKNKDMFQESVDSLKKAIKIKSDFSDAYFNLGRIMSFRKNNDNAIQYWKKYIKYDQQSNYSKQVYKALGIDKSSIVKNISTIISKIPKCPFTFGEVTPEIDSMLIKFDLTKYALPMGGIYGHYYSGNGFLVLELEGSIELIEKSFKEDIFFSEQILRRGSPNKIYENYAASTKTYIYDHFALNIKNNRLEKCIYYGRNMLHSTNRIN